jgi:ACT domain-containing protein
LIFKENLLKTKRRKKENGNMKKAVISVVGKDKVGIIFNVCKYLTENQINILDIAQTIVQDWFNMIMVVNMQESQKDFSEIASELKQVGEEIGVMITLQKEEIFDMMHRL